MKIKNTLLGILGAAAVTAGAAKADESNWVPSVGSEAQMDRVNLDSYDTTIGALNQEGFVKVAYNFENDKGTEFRPYARLGLGHRDDVEAETWTAETTTGEVYTPGETISPPRGRNENPGEPRGRPVWAGRGRNENPGEPRGRPVIQLPGSTETFEVENLTYNNFMLDNFSILPGFGLEVRTRDGYLASLGLDLPIQRAEGEAYSLINGVESSSSDSDWSMGVRARASVGKKFERISNPEQDVTLELGYAYGKNSFNLNGNEEDISFQGPFFGLRFNF